LAACLFPQIVSARERSFRCFNAPLPFVPLSYRGSKEITGFSLGKHASTSLVVGRGIATVDVS
jgi:hypothetical protein